MHINQKGKIRLGTEFCKYPYDKAKNFRNSLWLWVIMILIGWRQISLLDILVKLMLITGDNDTWKSL